MADRWVVLTSAFYPQDIVTRPNLMLEGSAEIQRVPVLRSYGCGEQYANWTRMKVNRMIPELEDMLNHGYTHYLYSDGRDAFFTRSWQYIMAQYEMLGRPDALLSGHGQPFTIRDLAPHWDHLKPAKYRFHCCGGYLGRIDWWLEAHRRFVRDDYENRPTGGDEAGVWQWAWVDGWFRPMVDTGCRIWQNLGGCEDDVELQANIHTDTAISLWNHHTKTAPAILHFTGYCKDPIYGVYDAMNPWWDAMYPEHSIGREEVAAC